MGKKNNKNNINKSDTYKLRVGGHFSLANVEPITVAQSKIVEEFEEKQKHLVIHGPPGTGKTFMPLYLALKKVLTGEDGIRDLYIVRSAVPGRNQGFLPGNESEKMENYELPYAQTCIQLFGRGDAYQVLKKRGVINFLSTSFNRGITLDNAIIIVDEAQNMSDQELHTITTRVGDNSIIIFCGDIEQDDLTSDRKKEYSGFRNHMEIMKNIESVSFIEFGVDDIVRSGFVKSYIIARMQHNKQ